MKGLMCYYSGTGNTKLACDYIAKRLKNIDFKLFDIVKDGIPDISSYDIIGFATWADFLNMPKKTYEFVNSLDGKGKEAFIFNTYGNLNGKTLKTLKKTVEKKNFKVIGGYALHTPENVPPLILNGMDRADAPYPEELKKFNSFLCEFDKWLKEYLINNSKKPIIYYGKGSNLPGFPRKTSKVLSSMFAGDFKVDEELCTQCGLCEKICPYKAIVLEKEYPKFETKNCYGCWACYNRCPTKAIYTKKYRGIGHYSEPNKLLKMKLK